MPHIIRLEISVPADAEVSADMVCNLLRNQLPLNPVAELDDNKGHGGLVHWRQVKVSTAV